MIIKVNESGYISGKVNLSLLKDIDNNVYSTVIIDTQEWIVQNLKTTRYADGTVIPNVTVDILWATNTDGAYCWYNNDILTFYGALYNWYAVNNIHGLVYFKRDGIQELGWRIPNNDDFDKLKVYLGIDAGDKLKEVGTTHWIGNIGATNESGFTALPGSFRWNSGIFYTPGTIALLYSSVALDITNAYYYVVQSYAAEFVMSVAPKTLGMSIRCVRDI